MIIDFREFITDERGCAYKTLRGRDAYARVPDAIDMTYTTHARYAYIAWAHNASVCTQRNADFGIYKGIMRIAVHAVFMLLQFRLLSLSSSSLLPPSVLLSFPWPGKKDTITVTSCYRPCTLVMRDSKTRKLCSTHLLDELYQFSTFGQ